MKKLNLKLDKIIRSIQQKKIKRQEKKQRQKVNEQLQLFYNLTKSEIDPQNIQIVESIKVYRLTGNEVEEIEDPQSVMPPTYHFFDSRPEFWFVVLTYHSFPRSHETNKQTRRVEYGFGWKNNIPFWRINQINRQIILKDLDNATALISFSPLPLNDEDIKKLLIFVWKYRTSSVAKATLNLILEQGQPFLRKSKNSTDHSDEEKNLLNLLELGIYIFRKGIDPLEDPIQPDRT